MILNDRKIKACEYALKYGIDEASRHYGDKVSSIERYLRQYKRDKERNSCNTDNLEFTGNYVYNKQDEKYIFLLSKKIGKDIVLEQSLVKSLIKAYSNYDKDPDSINQLTNKFSIPRIVIIEVLNALGFTHDSLPVTPEELYERDQNEIVDEILQDKRFTIYQELNKRDWKQTQKDAKNWQNFEAGILNPFKDFVNTFEPPAKQYKPKINSKPSNRVLIITVSDPHFGAHTDARSLYLGKEYNINKAQDSITQYLDEINRITRLYKGQFDKVYIFLMGDLLHSLDGKTQKGTELGNVHPKHTQQYQMAYNSLSFLIDGCLKLFPSVWVGGVGGNHTFDGDYAVMAMLEKGYNHVKEIDFIISESRWLSVQILNSLFVMEHGASAFYKSQVPKGISPREAYVQNLLLSKPQLLKDVQSRYFLTADLHSYESKEYNNFEFIRVSTPVCGDKYADELNLTSRPRQNCFIVGAQGIESIHNVYFD